MFIKQKSYIALLDTGADISCISADLAQNLISQNVVKMQPSSLSMIRGVGGQTTRVLGSLDVPLKIAGLTIPQSFIVVDTLTHPLILGVDFLQSHQASLNFATRDLLLYLFFILFKQECRMPIDTALRVGDIPSAAQPCMEEIVQNAELTKTMVTENIKTAQDRYNKHHDGKLPPPQYVVGQRVLLRCSHNLPGISSKLQQKYDGPYYVTKALPHNVYILRRCSDNKALKSPVNAARLRPYWTPDDRPTNPLEGDTDPVQTNLKDIPNTTTDLPTDPSAQAPAKPTNQPSDAETHVPPVDDDVYLVDRLMACKTVNNVKHYKVKWTGYKETTWEPAGNIPDELIRDFHLRKTRRRRTRHR